MKKVFSFFALTAIGLSLGVSSCSNEDPAKPLDINLKRTATIKGALLYVSDETEAAPGVWSAPNVNEDDFYVTVNYSELTGNNNAKGVYVLPKDKIKYAKKDGTFTITVPVGISDTWVNVKINSFEGEVKIGSNDYFSAIWDSKVGVACVAPSEVTYLQFFWHWGEYTLIEKVGDDAW